MIEAVRLSKRYADFEAVHELSFRVDDGQVVGLLGPNGAGKTTTMRMLTTFLPPSGGTAIVGGYDIVKEPRKVRANIGYLPETPPLYLEMRVREYLNYVGKIKGLHGSALRGAVDEVLERCSLTAVERRICLQLSKGYRQRVGLAQALIHKPQVIILDEPTSGLDPAQIIEMRQLIRSLGGKHTVVLSTHILPEVVETCSKVIIIAAGRISVEGDLQALTQGKSLEQRFMEAVAADEPELEVSASQPEQALLSAEAG